MPEKGSDLTKLLTSISVHSGPNIRQTNITSNKCNQNSQLTKAPDLRYAKLTKAPPSAV